MHSFGMGASSVQFRVGAPLIYDLRFAIDEFHGRVVKREQKTPQIKSLRALEVQVLSRPPIFWS